LILADRLEIGAENERRSVDKENMISRLEGTVNKRHGGNKGPETKFAREA
jgi:hypothetical protein